MNNLEEVLYLNPLELSGPEQMAIDLFLLEKSLAEKNFNMAVRFYTWDGDWLSIGKNQKELPKKWIELLNAFSVKNKIDLKSSDYETLVNSIKSILVFQLFDRKTQIEINNTDDPYIFEAIKILK